MSSPAIHNVAVTAASGNLGPHVVSALRDAGFKVTILTRAGSSSSASWPSDVTVTPVDYESKQSLVNALKGQQAVVSLFSGDAIGQHQIPLIDAAIEAGIYRFMPSEFGSDSEHPRNDVPIYEGKRNTLAYLKHIAAENPSFTYTAIMSGPFLDFGLMVPIFLDCKNRSVPLIDGGNGRVSTSTRQQVGLAVAGALKSADSTKNRVIKFAGATVTQNQLLRIAEATTGSKWKVENIDSREAEASAFEELNKPNPNHGIAVLGLLRGLIFREDRGSDFGDAVQNDLVGVKPLSQEEIKAEVEKWVRNGAKL